MSYPIDKIKAITESSFLQRTNNALIEHLLYDSRKLHFPAATLFFAIKANRRDGHIYIPELYKRGVRNFIISNKIDLADYPEGNFILTANTLTALQQIAAFHRREISSISKRSEGIEVIGITGSNGKTIVKEWLFQLLHFDYNIVRSPKSFNSQIGVPFSVWQMNREHTLAIFEAGISQPGEMEKLESIIQPTIGILTNIGEAHSEGFIDSAPKFSEKIKLFNNCKVIIAREKDIAAYFTKTGDAAANRKLLTWGNTDSNDFFVKSIEKRTKQLCFGVNQRLFRKSFEEFQYFFIRVRFASLLGIIYINEIVVQQVKISPC